MQTPQPAFSHARHAHAAPNVAPGFRPAFGDTSPEQRTSPKGPDHRFHSSPALNNPYNPLPCGRDFEYALAMPTTSEAKPLGTPNRPASAPVPRDLLALSLVPGVGPVLIARLLQVFLTAKDVLSTTAERLATVPGIGKSRAGVICSSREAAYLAADQEIELAARLGVQILAREHPDYPPLLREAPDAPVLLYVRGRLDPLGVDRFSLAIVGSRKCSQYGMEQTERFAGSLASAGITIVSGGARGIDTAAHRASIRLGGRTVAVLGCGLAHCYPEENADLFDQIAAGKGAIVSELPLNTHPAAENFPARNRIISAMSLGVLVIEAGHKSGSLITAKIAAEDHGRDVFALPGRVDSTACEGTLDLIKRGGALMVTSPGDILEALHQPARHVHAGTHEARYAIAGSDADLAATSTDEADSCRDNDDAAGARAESGLNQADLFSQPASPPVKQARAARPGIAPAAPRESARDANLTPTQAALLKVLDEPLSLDDLARTTGQPIATIRGDLTILEIRRQIKREGSRWARKA